MIAIGLSNVGAMLILVLEKCLYIEVSLFAGPVGEMAVARIGVDLAAVLADANSIEGRIRNGNRVLSDETKLGSLYRG